MKIAGHSALLHHIKGTQLHKHTQMAFSLTKRRKFEEKIIISNLTFTGQLLKSYQARNEIEG